MALRGSAVRIRLAPLLILQATSELFVSGTITLPEGNIRLGHAVGQFCGNRSPVRSQLFAVDQSRLYQ
jgi:hypothetical protein